MSIKIENVVLPSSDQWKVIIMGCRNPKNSWIRSDSKFNLQTTWESDQDFKIGPNDLKLMSTLCNAGTDHRKFMRMIPVYLDIIAPLYFWKEFSTYKVGTVANSCSTMHKIHAKEFTLEDFSHEHLLSEYNTSSYFVPEHDENRADIRPVIGFPDYDVSEFGDVYSWKSGKRVLLKLRTDIDGYKTVGLYKDGKCKRVKVHRLVADAFIPKGKGKDCVNHKDGNKWNNSVGNLEWCTRKENSTHASETGLLVYGSKQRIGRAKQRRLTHEQVQLIKELYHSDGVSQRELGRMFGCDHSVISEIVTGKIYNDISIFPLELLEETIDKLNELRCAYLESGDKGYWYSMIQLLPSSYNQRRTVMLNYEVLANIYKSRKGHRLDEWKTMLDWIETLPYSELITGESKDKNKTEGEDEED